MGSGLGLVEDKCWMQGLGLDFYDDLTAWSATSLTRRCLVGALWPAGCSGFEVFRGPCNWAKFRMGAEETFELVSGIESDSWGAFLGSKESGRFGQPSSGFQVPNSKRTNLCIHNQGPTPSFSSLQGGSSAASAVRSSSSGSI